MSQFLEWSRAVLKPVAAGLEALGRLPRPSILALFIQKSNITYRVTKQLNFKT